MFSRVGLLRWLLDAVWVYVVLANAFVLPCYLILFVWWSLVLVVGLACFSVVYKWILGLFIFGGVCGFLVVLFGVGFTVAAIWCFLDWILAVLHRVLDCGLILVVWVWLVVVGLPVVLGVGCCSLIDYVGGWWLCLVWVV